jgi:lipoyl(octanoyl) transferase
VTSSGAEALELRTYWLSSVAYRRAWQLQRAVVAAVRAGRQPPSLLLLEHPHVFTIGRRGDGSTLLWGEEECRRRGIEVVWTDRGGDATYHGPGQLVGYPIVDVARLGTDVLRFIRGLEDSLVSYLATLGLEAEPGGQGLTGVWSRGAKVAAIGIKLTDRVTSHGFALNLTTDLEIFNRGIVPCGLVGRRATSVLELSGLRVEVADAARAYAPHFGRRFGVRIRWADPAELWTLPVAEGDPEHPAGPASEARSEPAVSQGRTGR